jgi:FAD/FMN-containing dehydrogenase
MGQPTVDTAALEGFGGDLLRDGDSGYDESRTVFNASIDRRPALIARCTGVADVIAAIGFAREQGLAVSVRGGGHSVAGHAVVDGGLMIDMRPMNRVRVDPEQRTAWCGGGANWGELDRETQAFGLAVTGGRLADTGVGGLTLGGGSGWLERKYGFTVDSLLSAEVVTAAGELVIASAGRNPDLFWALKGGGGNFGVVTGFEFRLHEVGRCYTAG